MRAIGRVAESWRFQVKAAWRAREHALESRKIGSVSSPSLIHKNVPDLPTSAFEEVPSEAAGFAWKTVHASKVMLAQNILKLEADALVVAVRHLVRASP